jgi:hypothetical protein
MEEIIKCPCCGSTAQVRENIPHTDKEGNYIWSKYVCGCGCYFDEGEKPKKWEKVSKKA